MDAFDPARLRAVRTEEGLSLAELARAANVPETAVSKYESGTGRPTVRSLARLALALRLKLADLLDTSVLGHGFRALRLAAGLEQSEVAERVGIAVGMYKALEYGHVERLREFDGASLARVFGVGVDQVRAAHQWDLEHPRSSGSSSRPSN